MSEKKKGWAGLKEAFHPRTLRKDITQSIKSGSAAGEFAVYGGVVTTVAVLAPPAVVALPVLFAGLIAGETIGSDVGKATFRGIGKLKNRVLNRSPKTPPTTPGV